MREVGLGNKEIQGKKLNPNPFSLVFGLGKSPNVDKGFLYSCKWVLVLVWIGLEECL